jgi:Holliday junction resolvasome RuvABC endonuclease subunit
MEEFYFLGYDQGVANSGIAVLKFKLYKSGKLKKEVVYYKWVKTSSKDEMPQRLCKIYDELDYAFRNFDISAVACEKLWKNDTNKRTGRNSSAGMMSANTSSAILMLLAGKNDIYFRQYVPATVKKISTGSGLAKKEDMINYVLKEYKIKDNICEHIADAICIGNAIGIEYLQNCGLIY